MKPEERAAIAQEIAELERRISDLRLRAFGSSAPAPILEKGTSLLVCDVGETRVAFVQDAVDEVVHMCSLTPLAEAPGWIPGLLNFHGSSVPIIDVQARVTGQLRRARSSDLILLCRSHGRLRGLVVQTIADIVRCETPSVEPVPPETTYASYLHGVLHIGERQLLLLSIDRLLGDSDVPPEVGA
jgi:chemotaxis signal transduction protein